MSDRYDGGEDPDWDGGYEMDGGEGAADASSDAKVDAALDLSCVELTPLRNFKAEPSGLGVLFTAVTCADKTPVPGLTPSSFVIAEDDQPLSSEADPDFVPSRGRRVYISLLLDMSNSTAPVVDKLIAGAQRFVNELLVKRKINVFIGIELFDGAVNTVAWQQPIRDPERLAAKLGKLKDYKAVDGASTNLNGAVITTISKLQTHQQKVIDANDRGVVTQGYLVVFTDGADSAGRQSVNDAARAIANANAMTRLLTEKSLPPVDTYAVALNGKDYNAATFAELFTGTRSGSSDAGSGSFWDAGSSSDGGIRGGSSDAGTSSGSVGGLSSAEASRRVVEAENGEALAKRFEELAQRIAGQLEGTYLLAYCSPKRQGTHKLTLRLASATAPGSTGIALTFDATGFAGGCSAELFTSSCDTKQCGGFNCGACDDETETCNAQTDRCENACLASSPPRCDGSTFTNAMGYAQTCDFKGAISQCGSACIDTSSDPMNCGGCNRRCNPSSTCVQGACVCGDSSELSCSDGCFDGQTDRNHCGGCTNVCPASNPHTGAAVACESGACNCGAGYTFCAAPVSGVGSCVDTNTDRNNCGGCGIQCSGDASCVAGQCTCSTAGYSSCQSSPTSKVQMCVNTQTNSSHCGACGKACGPSGTCTAGACVCGGGTTLCNGTCATTMTDVNNCGSCGKACQAGQFCSAGVCSSGPFADCSSASISGSLPMAYEGVFGAPAPSACLGGSVPTTTLQFVAPKTGIYSFGFNSDSAYLSLDTGSCASPSPTPYSCNTYGDVPLSAGAAVRITVMSAEPESQGFVLFVEQQLR